MLNYYQTKLQCFREIYRGLLKFRNGMDGKCAAVIVTLDARQTFRPPRNIYLKQFKTFNPIELIFFTGAIRKLPWA